MLSVTVQLGILLVCGLVSRFFSRQKSFWSGVGWSFVAQLVVIPVMVMASGTFAPYRGGHPTPGTMLFWVLCLLASLAVTGVFTGFAFSPRGQELSTGDTADGDMLPANSDPIPTRKRNWRFWLATLLWGAGTLFTTWLAFTALWVTRNFGNVTADSLRFFLGENPFVDATPEMLIQTANQVVVPMLAVTFLVLWLRLGAENLRIQKNNQPKTISLRLANLVSAGVVIVSLVASLLLLPIVGTIQGFFGSSTLVADNYVKPTDKILHFPAKKKNLIFIVMESMENSYYSKAEGGYLNKSLMPDLAQLTKENVSFSNSDKFGGPHQIPGANHSVAGIFNFTTGIPLAPVSFSDKLSMAYADVPNLGSILHAHGYNNFYMMGADSNFHQMKDYFTKYQDFQMFDRQTARDEGLVPPNYLVWWGVEDDKLYEFAKLKMTKLAGEHKPFYFLLENADTHNPHGYLSPRATEFPSSDKYGNVIHYSQRETVKLVRWIQQQPWYKDTVIVITGDHRSMDVRFFKGWDPNYERRIVNIFINGADPDPSRKVTTFRKYGSYDIFPTIVSALGIKIDGHRLGIGTDLYSGAPTLMERIGINKVDSQVTKRSQWYEKRLIRELGQKEIQKLHEHDLQKQKEATQKGKTGK